MTRRSAAPFGMKRWVSPEFDDRKEMPKLPRAEAILTHQGDTVGEATVWYLKVHRNGATTKRTVRP